jgi:hypothetical protein
VKKNPVKLQVHTDQDNIYLTLKSDSGCKLSLTVQFPEPSTHDTPPTSLKLPQMNNNGIASLRDGVDMPVA